MTNGTAYPSSTGHHLQVFFVDMLNVFIRCRRVKLVWTECAHRSNHVGARITAMLVERLLGREVPQAFLAQVPAFGNGIPVF